MQTFLPYSRFDTSAAVLDDLRLGKQRVETLQILRALVYPSYRGWKNHPATTMWRGFTAALVTYGVTMCDEWERRGRADAVRSSLLAFAGGTALGQEELARQGRLPRWLGLPEFHASHRSALVAKQPEHYRERFPEAAPERPYLWPRPMFPRWPVRRSRAMGARAAAAALGPAADPDDEHVRALVAALGTPGRTLWLHDRPYEPSPRPESLRPPVTERPPGSVSPSIARPPTEEDLASVAEEIRTRPLLRVHRVADLRDAALRADLGAPSLVVLEGVPRPDRVRRMFPDAKVLAVASAD